MKNEEQKNDWQDEMKQMAPWLPLNGSAFRKFEAPNDYFEELERNLFKKINAGNKDKSRFTRQRRLLAIAAGFLLVFYVGKYLWVNSKENIEIEYDISKLSEEEVDLWLKEEAIISDLDLQLYVDGLTFTDFENEN